MIYGPHKTLYNRFIRWSRLGVFDRIFAGLAAHRSATSLPKKGDVPRRIGRTKGGLNHTFTTWRSTTSATSSRTCSQSSRTGGASPPATTHPPTPSSRPSASQQPSSSGSDQRVLSPVHKKRLCDKSTDAKCSWSGHSWAFLCRPYSMMPRGGINVETYSQANRLSECLGL